MAGLRLNVMMDDQLRRDLTEFIREQARPLVKDCINTVAEKLAAKTIREKMTQYVTANYMTHTMETEIKTGLSRYVSSLGAAMLREIGSDKVMEEVRTAIGRWCELHLREEYNKVLEERIKAVLRDIR